MSFTELSPLILKSLIHSLIYISPCIHNIWPCFQRMYSHQISFFHNIFTLILSTGGKIFHIYTLYIHKLLCYLSFFLLTLIYILFSLNIAAVAFSLNSFPFSLRLPFFLCSPLYALVLNTCFILKKQWIHTLPVHLVHTFSKWQFVWDKKCYYAC